MLSHRLLVVAMSVLCLLIGFNAEADCSKGFQPWHRNTSGIAVCLPHKMISYLSCLETSGGGTISVERSNATGSSKKVNVGLEGGGGTPLAKGKGKITVDYEEAEAAINKIKHHFDPGNSTTCFKAAAAFGESPSAPQKKPKKARKPKSPPPKKVVKTEEVPQSGDSAPAPNSDPLFPKLVGNDVVFPAEVLESTTRGFKSGDKFYIAFHKNGWTPSKGDKRYEMQREGDKLIAKGVVNRRFHPVLVSPLRYHKIERAYSEYRVPGEFKNNIDSTNPDGPCYCFGTNCVPYNQGGQ